LKQVAVANKKKNNNTCDQPIKQTNTQQYPPFTA